MTGAQATSKGQWEEGAGIMTLIPLFHTQYANQEQWQPKHGGPGNGQATPHDNQHQGFTARMPESKPSWPYDL
jgi:hypothetical protein